MANYKAITVQHKSKIFTDHAVLEKNSEHRLKWKDSMQLVAIHKTKPAR